MADHSLNGYLQRRTTKELEIAWAYCLREENYVNHERVILEILKIFCERDAQEEAEANPQNKDGLHD